MKLITNVKIERADHTEVIDQAATQVVTLASKVALAVFNRVARDAQRVIGYGGATRHQVNAKVADYNATKITPVWQEVKESAIAVFEHGCQRQSEYVRHLIQTQVTRRVDAHWDLHEQTLGWLKAQTQVFLAQEPVEGASEVQSEGLGPAITEAPELTTSAIDADEPAPDVAEVIEPAEDVTQEAPAAPTTPADKPVGGKRRTRPKAKASISNLIKEEVGKA